MSDLERLVAELARRVVREELARLAPEWEWLTVGQAAELLGCSEKAIRARVDRGTLVAHRLDGRLYLSRRELDEAIREAPTS